MCNGDTEAEKGPCPWRAIAASVRLVSVPGSCGRSSKPPLTRCLEDTAGPVPSAAGSPGGSPGLEPEWPLVSSGETLSWPRPVPRGPICLG